MARKQNYSYERFQRQTNKAAKKEAKRETRAARGLLPADGTTGDEDRTEAEADAGQETVRMSGVAADSAAQEAD